MEWLKATWLHQTPGPYTHFSFAPVKRLEKKGCQGFQKGDPLLFNDAWFMNCSNCFPKSAFPASSLSDNRGTKILLVCKIRLFRAWSRLLDPERKKHRSLQRAAGDRCLLHFLMAGNKSETWKRKHMLWNPPPSAPLEPNADLSDFYAPTPSALLPLTLWSVLQRYILSGFRPNGIVENKLCKFPGPHFLTARKGVDERIQVTLHNPPTPQPPWSCFQKQSL